MKLTIDIPANVERSLQQRVGPDLAQAAKEALAMSWYQAEKLSIGQVAEFLGMSVYEADGFMKRHNIAAPYSITDFEDDRKTLSRVLQK